jgi:hypothetical protein
MCRKRFADRKKRHEEHKAYVLASHRTLLSPTYHIILKGGWYRIRDPQEVLLTETGPIEGLEGVNTKLTSVDTIPVSSTVVRYCR